MKPNVKIEELIRRFEVETDVSKDTAILDSLLAAQARSQYRGSGFALALKAGAIAVAAGILIVCAVLLSGTHQINEPHSSGETIAKTQSPTPSELTSVMSLDMAYYRGGIEAVQEQLDLAEKQMTSKPNEPVTIEQLRSELLDDC